MKKYLLGLALLSCWLTNAFPKSVTQSIHVDYQTAGTGWDFQWSLQAFKLPDETLQSVRFDFDAFFKIQVGYQNYNPEPVSGLFSTSATLLFTMSGFYGNKDFPFFEIVGPSVAFAPVSVVAEPYTFFGHEFTFPLAESWTFTKPSQLALFQEFGAQLGTQIIATADPGYFSFHGIADLDVTYTYGEPSFQPVPEPSTVGLFAAMGLIGTTVWRNRRRRQVR
jgi:hypothetical protein